MYSCPRVLITHYLKINGLNNKSLLSHSCGGEKFEMRVSVGHTPSGDSEEGSLSQAPLLTSGGSLACDRIAPIFTEL